MDVVENMGSSFFYLIFAVLYFVLSMFLKRRKDKNKYIGWANR